VGNIVLSIAKSDVFGGIIRNWKYPELGKNGKIGGIFLGVMLVFGEIGFDWVCFPGIRSRGSFS